MSEAQQFAWGSSLAMRAPLPAVCEPDEEYGQPAAASRPGAPRNPRPPLQLGHRDLQTTMIYTHVLNRGGRGVRSPADHLLGSPTHRD
jgi:hypothetical protein